MARALVLSFALILSTLASPVAAMPLPGDVPAEGCLQRLPLDRASFEAAPLPVGALVPCPGVRPGARVWIENDGTSGCTLNFVFRGTRLASDGTPIDEGLFIGTAGHCVLDADGEQTWASGEGPVAKDANDRRFGEVAYAVLGGTAQLSLDFALIRVDDPRESEVKPGLCHFGGPTGMSATWKEGDLVHHFGQGLVYERTVQGRSGVVTSGQQITASAIMYKGSALFGDSGSSLIQSDGDALGVVVGILPPAVFATPIAPQVDLAENKLGMELTLATAPLA